MNDVDVWRGSAWSSSWSAGWRQPLRRSVPVRGLPLALPRSHRRAGQDRRACPWGRSSRSRGRVRSPSGQPERCTCPTQPVTRFSSASQTDGSEPWPVMAPWVLPETEDLRPTPSYRWSRRWHSLRTATSILLTAAGCGPSIRKGRFGRSQETVDRAGWRTAHRPWRHLWVRLPPSRSVRAGSSTLRLHNLRPHSSCSFRLGAPLTPSKQSCPRDRSRWRAPSTALPRSLWTVQAMSTRHHSSTDGRSSRSHRMEWQLIWAMPDGVVGIQRSSNEELTMSSRSTTARTSCESRVATW